MFLPNMSWVQPPGYVHVMHTATWQPNGLRVAISNGPPAGCDYYAFFGDHCRTWVGRCTRRPWTGGTHSSLHRNMHNGSFPVIAKDTFCDNVPDFQDYPDWPNATSTDEGCRQRCLTHSPSALSASAQRSDDGKTIAVRFANTADAPITLRLNVTHNGSVNGGGPHLGNATLWTLASPIGNILDANTPAEPTRVSPVKSAAPADGSLTLPAWSAAVVVMEYV
eukprot:CAMPEP_0181193292 /NCGR_PEP_ID=MMETSP1096-20121128/13742_1 /TAXON_ID=156174 ORGANISM="Chrysochromulina ericina, Strain CCMP281" /NCGR_SAMPLE_ID=MMETSP1096 /ASSEMBLY_ACC=CAM_ASM_000453 /LENGTH=221 /DNA_ID=CAMNT_0023282751 /DNA_START=12 /DNA_END=677 /DNA_ORIENTATION=-